MHGTASSSSPAPCMIRVALSGTRLARGLPWRPRKIHGHDERQLNAPRLTADGIREGVRLTLQCAGRTADVGAAFGPSLRKRASARSKLC